MKKFMVAVWETEGGRVWVEANNKEEAEELVFDAVESGGINDLPPEWNYDPTHREYQIADSQEC